MYQGNRGTRVRVGEIEMEYEEHGEGGRPFVLVHGFTGSRDDWREQLPRLAARGRTIAVDLRGHGDTTNTGTPRGTTSPSSRVDVIGFLDALGTTRCDLLGHSMGGVVAQIVTLEEPGRIASLVLMDTRPSRSAGGTRATSRRAGKIATEPGMETLFEVSRTGAERDPNRPASVGALPSSAWARSTTGRASAPSSWRWTRSPSAPSAPRSSTTAGVAHRLGRDPLPDDGDRRRRGQALPQAGRSARGGASPARARWCSPAGAHCPQLEDPDAWLAAVDAHLEWTPLTAR